MYFKQRYRIAVWIVSGVVGLLIMSTPILLKLYVPQRPYIIPLDQGINNTFAFGLIIALVFPAVVEYNNYRWGRQVDRHVPRLLRDVSEAVQSGVTLPRALEEASKRDYGPLSKEIEYTISTFILGASWEDSIMSLAQRLKRPSALRLCTILVEAHQTGGKMVEVLDASVILFSSLDEYRKEQNNGMRPYVLTIYMAAIIFLIIAYVVLHQFLAPLCATSIDPMVGDSGLLSGILDINYYTSILFWASIIESVFGGFIAGQIGNGNLTAGLHHSVILTIFTLIIFNIPST